MVGIHMAKRFPRRLNLILLILMGSLAGENGQAQAPLFSKFGIGTFHPLQERRRSDNRVDAGAIEAVPTLQQAEHLYVFCINGGDPLCLGNFNGVAQFIKSQGCPNTYFGQLWHANKFHSQIKQIHASDSQAQIVLIGLSFGANRVRSLANQLDAEGIAVALVVYLAGDAVENNDYSRPKNVGRVVNIRAHGMVVYGGHLFFKGEEINGARNVLVDARHMLSPSRAETIEYLAQELADTAKRSKAEQPLVGRQSADPARQGTLHEAVIRSAR